MYYLSSAPDWSYNSMKKIKFTAFFTFGWAVGTMGDRLG